MPRALLPPHLPFSDDFPLYTSEPFSGKGHAGLGVCPVAATPMPSSQKQVLLTRDSFLVSAGRGTSPHTQQDGVTWPGASLTEAPLEV